MWVCVITIEAWGMVMLFASCALTFMLVRLGLRKFGMRIIKGVSVPASGVNFKRFLSSRKARKGESQQEVALQVLQTYYWTLAYNIVLAEISIFARLRARRRGTEAHYHFDEKQETEVLEPGEEPAPTPIALAPPPSPHLYTCFQPGCLRPPQPDAQVCS